MLGHDVAGAGGIGHAVHGALHGTGRPAWLSWARPPDLVWPPAEAAAVAARGQVPVPRLPLLPLLTLRRPGSPGGTRVSPEGGGAAGRVGGPLATLGRATAPHQHKCVLVGWSWMTANRPPRHSQRVSVHENVCPIFWGTHSQHILSYLRCS